MKISDYNVCYHVGTKKWVRKGQKAGDEIASCDDYV